jgi:hypothetical protein
MSLRSQLSPTQRSVDTLFPVPVVVVPQLHTKHVRPDLVAEAHSPRPEHDEVELVHASRVAWHVEMEPMGDCGGGRGKGACEACGPGARLAAVCRDGSNVRRATRALASMARSRRVRVASATSRYAALSMPSRVRMVASPESSSAAKAESGAVSRKEARDCSSSVYQAALDWDEGSAEKIEVYACDARWRYVEITEESEEMGVDGGVLSANAGRKEDGMRIAGAGCILAQSI